MQPTDVAPSTQASPWQRFLLWLDEKRWPQRFVQWVLRRRQRSRLTRYLFPSKAATHAVCLSVSSPLLSTDDLVAGVVPIEFGSWRDFKVEDAMVSGSVAMAVLQELRSGVEFALVVPVHAGFQKGAFLRSRVLRLTCEAARARLVTVRRRDGLLLAAGTLEATPRAAYSTEVQS